MKSYRLLLLDSKGRLLGSRSIECMTDGEAIALAERESGVFALIEIWRGGDLIGTFTNPRAGDRQPGVSKAQIQTLAGLDFLRRADNVLFIGKPGTGKTGPAMGLLREACLNGYRGRFYNAQVLLDELYASLADRTTTRLLAHMSRMRPLVIDELGYLTLKPDRPMPSSA